MSNNTLLSSKVKINAMTFANISKIQTEIKPVNNNQAADKRKSNLKAEMKKRKRNAKIKRGVVAALVCIAPLMILSALMVS